MPEHLHLAVCSASGNGSENLCELRDALPRWTASVSRIWPQDMVTVRINGEPHRFEAPVPVSDMLRALDLGSDGVAVEVNRAVIPRRSHSESVLEDGDEVEIVTFVGGG